MSTATITVKPGIQVESRRRSWSETNRTRRAKSRIYMDVRGETLLDNLMNRTSRPVQDWSKLLRTEVLPALGMEGVKVRWNKNAGCSMCPCSPGWIVEGYLVNEDYSDATDAPLTFRPKTEWGNLSARDVWVTVDFETLDIPAFLQTPQREARAAQLVG